MFCRILAMTDPDSEEGHCALHYQVRTLHHTAKNLETSSDHLLPFKNAVFHGSVVLVRAKFNTTLPMLARTLWSLATATPNKEAILTA